MQMKKVGLNLVLLLSLLLLTTACKFGEIQNPQIDVIKSSFKSVSLKQGRLDTQLRVTNPNVFKLPIKAVSYKLFLNEKEFIAGTSQLGLKIPAGGNQLVELPVDIEYEKLLGGLGSLFKNKAIRFQLKGEIDFGLVSVPYRKTGEFKIN
jgi:LEA14-like dessication related protein